MTEPSRRTFLRLSGFAAGAAAAGLPLMGEPELARAAAPAALPTGLDTAGAVLINANEYPLGPSPAAQKAALQLLPRSGRYLFAMGEDLARLFAAQHGLPADHVVVYPGSSVPLNYATLAFTSPTAAAVVADPSYEQPSHTARRNQAKVHAVPLREDFSHDVQAMAAADPRAGLIYLCNPNNPTGTVTSRKDIEWLLANKPKSAIVLVDEAYIHFSDAPSVLDLVTAGHDLVVLRTFSKLYGMAGMRLGLAAARPDLLKRIQFFMAYDEPVPVMTAAAGLASLQDAELVPRRKQANAAIRDDTLAWLRSRGYRVTPSQTNFFMVDVRRPGPQFAAAMAAQQVFVGRSWPIWPNHIRVTVGTAAEMQRFKSVFGEVSDGRSPLTADAAESYRRHAGYALA